MRPISFTYAPTPSSANNICLAQQTAGAANLVLNGSKVSDGIATLGDQQHILFTTTEDDSGVNATITGFDKSFQPITETLSLPNNTTKASTKNFWKVTQIAVDGAIAADMTVGVNGLGESQPYVLDTYISPFEVSFAVQAVTAATYKGQYTYDNVMSPSWPNGTQNWLDSSTMTGKTGAFEENYTSPVMAVRIAITTQGASQSVAGRIVQAGGGL